MDVHAFLTAIAGAEHTVNLKVEPLQNNAHRISLSKDFPAGVVGPGALSVTAAYTWAPTGIVEMAVEGVEDLGMGNLPSHASTT